MLNTTGLNLANTPPIGLSLRFFLLAPFFALITGILLAAGTEATLLSRWAPTTLAMTHLLLLGFITPIICGALLQILPVLLGARAAMSPRTGIAMVILLGLGVTLLSAGFGFSNGALLLSGAVLTASTLLIFAIKIAITLFTSPGSPPLKRTLMIAVSALAVTVMLGLLLAGSRSGWLDLAIGKAWTDIHLTWGLAGWLGLLLAGISSELIPMFYLTPQMPKWLLRGFPIAVIGLLVLLPITVLFNDTQWFPPGLAMAILLLFSSFASTHFIHQRRRRRPRRDASLGFWWLGQAAIVMTTVAWLFDAPATLIGVLAIVGAGMSFTIGTLFKIVPFLSWYHLQSCKMKNRRIDIKLPNMQGFIGNRAAEWQLAVHGATLLLLVLGTWQQTATIRLGGLMLVASALLLWFSLARAWWRYQDIRYRLLRGGKVADPN